MQNKEDLAAIWKFAYENMKEEHKLPSTAIELWFGRMALMEITPEAAVFAVDLITKIDVIRNRYTEYIKEHLKRVVGYAPGEIKIYVDSTLKGAPPVGDGIISPLRKMRDSRVVREAEAATREAVGIFDGESDEGGSTAAEEKKNDSTEDGNVDDGADGCDLLDMRDGTQRSREEMYRRLYEHHPELLERIKNKKNANGEHVFEGVPEDSLLYAYLNGTYTGDDAEEDYEEDDEDNEASKEKKAPVNEKKKTEYDADEDEDEDEEEKQEREGSGERRLRFNTDYTFDNFIVGSSNSFAQAAALSVANSPGGQYNPLFLYGNSGLGKTHLMYAIANKVLENDPYKKVIYVKGEEFTNQLIDALRVDKNHEFREKYRKADMLLIDDIQFIAGKNATQTEFFHTFDALYEDHRQIIITSDRPPKEIENLDERIKNRFEFGLLADIKPPDYELRLAILKEKTHESELDIPVAVLSYIAERLNSNIRQIEGVVKKLGANHFLTGAPINIEMVRTTLPEFINLNDNIDEYVDKIIAHVAERYDTTVAELLGPKRTKEIKNARNMAMYIVRDMTGLSLPKIGVYFNRDYSTVHSNISFIEKQALCDTAMEGEIQDIESGIKNSM